MELNRMEWIACVDAMPPWDEEVLVWVDGHRGPSWRNNHALVAYLTGFGHFAEERHGGEILIRVTHWMPLPEPPDGE